MLPAEIHFTHFSLDFNIHYTQKIGAIAGTAFQQYCNQTDHMYLQAYVNR